MQVIVIVDVPDIDADSPEADDTIEEITIDLKSGLRGWKWHIEDAFGPLDEDVESKDGC